MRLVKENGKYVFQGTYHERHIPKGAGFRWNKDKKVWWTDEVNKAAKLAEYAADQATVESLVEESKQFNKILEESLATDSSIAIPKPKGSFNYLPFQRAGIEYGSKRESVLIADEMGLGKTIQAIGILNLKENLQNVLIICPASLKLNWKRELKKWLVPDLSIGVANAKDGIPETNIIIINYDVLKKYKDKLLKNWDCVIVDECHFIKNSKAQRSKLVIEIGSLSDQRILLTGTPIVNRPKELWNIVNFLAPEKFKNFWWFHKRFCNAYHNGYGWDFDGAKNLDELQVMLRQLIMVRRLKKDVLTELPPKLRQVIEIPCNGRFTTVIENERSARADSDRIIEEMKNKLEELKAKKDNFSPTEYDDAVKNLKQTMGYAFGEIARIRHETALAKVPVVLDYIKEVLESEKKVVVFAHHRDVIEAINTELGDKSVILYGGMDEIKKQESVDRFQNDENVKVFIGSIQAAGVGITLTAASHVIFTELDWVPGNLTQAEDRCHRIGQLDSVLVQHIVLENSIDAKLAKTIVEKQKIIYQAIDEDQKINIEHRQIENSINTEHIRQNGGQRASDNSNNGSVLSEEDRDLVHSAIKRIADGCDGALNIDNIGFNKMDANFGHSLARWNGRLTERQAISGLRMIWKYKGQMSEELVEGLEKVVIKIKRAKEEGRL